MERRDSKLFGTVVFILVFLIIFVSFLAFLVVTDNMELEDRIKTLSFKVDDKYDAEPLINDISFYSDMDKRITDKYDEYYSNIALLEDKINRGESSVKIAYLTFDDGPYELTYSVLDLLKANDIRATFFVLGKEGVNDRYLRIVNDSFISQVTMLEDYLYNVTGYRTSIVRFPGGSPTAGVYKDEIVNRLHEMGYNYVDWTSETGDGSSKKLAEKNTWNWYVDTVYGKNIVVLLMHDYNYSTYNNLQAIIDDMRNQGYIFLPLHNKSCMVK